MTDPLSPSRVNAAHRQPIRICSKSLELGKAGRVLPGKTTLPFSIPLQSTATTTANNRTLYETYHGVFLAVQYVLRVTLKRSFPNKSITKKTEFFIQYAKDGPEENAVQKPLAFTITPQSVTNKERGTVPNIKVTGKLDSSSCLLSKPLTGHLKIEKCEKPLKSIDMQLIRVETCGSGDTQSRNHTEVQTLQMGDGDVSRGMDIPIYMVLPRLFTCPTIETPNFKIEFDLNLIFLFDNGFLIKENFPISLHRF